MQFKRTGPLYVPDYKREWIIPAKSRPGYRERRPVMAYTLKANTGAGNTSGGVTTTGIDTTGANLIVLVLIDYVSSAISAITDSNSNAWTALTSQATASTTRSTIFYCFNPTVGAAHTVTATRVNGFATLFVSAWSGSVTSPFDVENGAQSGSSTVSTLQTGNITPGSNNELVISGTGVDAINTVTIDSGMTITDQVNYSAGNHWGGGMAYIIQTTAGAINSKWSYPTPARASAVIGSFKAGTATVVPQIMNGYRQRVNS